MRSCPSCGCAGIYEHSFVTGKSFVVASERERCPLRLFIRCNECGAGFEVDGERRLRAMAGSLSDDDLNLWVAPPWVEPSAAADFELSWDVADHTFRMHSRKDPSGLVIRALMNLLRPSWGSRLRAVFSVGTLLLCGNGE